MTLQQAQERINDILNGLDRSGNLPPGGQPFTLRGGQLRTAPHPELPTHWRPLWEPVLADLRPLDLEEFTVSAAVKQIARYGHETYLPVRRKLESFMDALQGEKVPLVEGHSSPDSFLAGDGRLAIVEVSRGAGHEPEYRIEFESTALPQQLEPGEAPVESRITDVTDMAVAYVLALVKGKRPG